MAAGGPLGRATVRGQLRCLTRPKGCWCRGPVLGMGGASQGKGAGPEARPRLTLSQGSREDSRREGE